MSTGIDPREVLLDVVGLKKHFPVRGAGKGKDVVKAVDNVSFHIHKGETFGLVGESGCGKSTTGRSIVRLYDVTDGSIMFGGQDVAKMNERQLKPFRKRMQTIFQDPYSSLNPGMNVLQIISEPMEIHNYASKAEMKGRALDLMNRVGLKPEHAERYPHEFSGGQRQRISIARALSVNPEFILCDEPLSALDVSVQAQVVNMLEDLQAELGLTYLFIAHDLSMVRHISNRIGVMYRGKLVEVAPTEELYRNPVHPYTQALLAAIPVPDPTVRNVMPPIYSGDTDPSARGRDEEPEWMEVSPGHFVSGYRDRI
ncbi:ABC transporter ATP-binding protein [Paenibacillus taichungensis]